nr:hypothetical protein [uncultured Campylobacter sp.]
MTRIYAQCARKRTIFAGAKFIMVAAKRLFFKTPILKIRRMVNLARKTRCALNLSGSFAARLCE